MTLTFAFLQEYGPSDQQTLWWRGFVTQQIVYAVIFYPVSCKGKFSQMWDFMAATFYTNAANKSWSSWALKVGARPIVYIRRKKGTKLTACVHSQSKSEQICLNFVIPPQTDDAPDINILIWRLYSKAIIQSAFCTYVSEIYFYTFRIVKEQQKQSLRDTYSKKPDTKPGSKIFFNIPGFLSLIVDAIHRIEVLAVFLCLYLWQKENSGQSFDSRWCCSCTRAREQNIIW